MSDVIRRSLPKPLPQDKIFDALADLFRDDAKVTDDGDTLVLKGVYRMYCDWEARIRLVTRDDRPRLVAEVSCTWTPLFWIAIVLLTFMFCVGGIVPPLQYVWAKGKLMTLIENRLDEVIDELG